MHIEQQRQVMVTATRQCVASEAATIKNLKGKSDSYSRKTVRHARQRRRSMERHLDALLESEWS